MQHTHSSDPVVRLSPPQPSRALARRIRTEWLDLTEEEISWVERDRLSFYEAVTRKYGETRAHIEAKIRLWERECSAAH